MTARDWAACLLAVVGAAAREAGHALVTLADVLDPPIVWPERVEVPNTVPEAWQVTW